VARIQRRPGVAYAGLALNEKGYERLLASGLDEVHFAFAASETFNQANGLRGCLFAPRATVNIATEDLVYLLHGEGIHTGIDLGALVSVAQWMERVLDKELPGQVYKAGTFAPVAS
jgi:isopropylmalate/homocitrate/citramalate synthase